MRGVEQRPALYDRLIQPLDRAALAQWRRRLFGALAGEILELGAGTGLNFGAYGPLAQITAIEIEPQHLVFARSRAWQRGARLLAADAQSLPFDDATFDYVTSALVFCTIPDPVAALREAARVLRPGGRLIQLEHTRTNQPLVDVGLAVIAPVWKTLAGGCVLNRDTPALLEAEGWRLLRHERYAAGLIRLIEATPAR
jgi:ubiquinone/menaquinone biosynthesis C-methylase UbiE